MMPAGTGGASDSLPVPSTGINTTTQSTTTTQTITATTSTSNASTQTQTIAATTTTNHDGDKNRKVVPLGAVRLVVGAAIGGEDEHSPDDAPAEVFVLDNGLPPMSIMETIDEDLFD
jgi:hypothetical protein